MNRYVTPLYNSSSTVAVKVARAANLSIAALCLFALYNLLML